MTEHWPIEIEHSLGFRTANHLLFSTLIDLQNGDYDVCRQPSIWAWNQAKVGITEIEGVSPFENLAAADT